MLNRFFFCKNIKMLKDFELKAYEICHLSLATTTFYLFIILSTNIACDTYTLYFISRKDINLLFWLCKET